MSYLKNTIAGLVSAGAGFGGGVHMGGYPSATDKNTILSEEKSAYYYNLPDSEATGFAKIVLGQEYNSKSKLSGIDQWKAIPNNKLDAGGLTNMGITYTTFTYLCPDVLDTMASYDLFAAMTRSQADGFVRWHWDMVGGNYFKSPAVAGMVAHIAWGSGVKTAFRLYQQCLQSYDTAKTKEVTVDGVMGHKTINFGNKLDQEELLNRLQSFRESFLHSIVDRKPTQSVFINGWINGSRTIKNQLNNWSAVMLHRRNLNSFLK
jgi:hypothetical protein